MACYGSYIVGKAVWSNQVRKMSGLVGILNIFLFLARVALNQTSTGDHLQVPSFVELVNRIHKASAAHHKWNERPSKNRSEPIFTVFANPVQMDNGNLFIRISRVGADKRMSPAQVSAVQSRAHDGTGRCMP